MNTTCTGDNPEAKWWEFVRAICDEEEKWVKQEIREKSQIPVFDNGDVGSWLWQVWDLYLMHGTLEAQRFQEVEAALGGSHLVWF